MYAEINQQQANHEVQSSSILGVKGNYGSLKFKTAFNWHLYTHFNFIQPSATVAMATKQIELQQHQQESESFKEYFIGLWEDHVGSTKPWEGGRLIHLNITLTLVLSATGSRPFKMPV